VRNIYLSKKTGLDTIINVHMSSCKVPDSLVRFRKYVANINVCNIFSKNKKIRNFTKIRRVGAELFHADGQNGRRTDRQTEKTKIIVTFGSFVNAPKNQSVDAV
jgi:hypothetical protein